MKEHDTILSEAKKYAEEILRNLSPDITYHCLQHTQSVVEAGQEIGLASHLNAEELEVIELACWFHDLGYLHGATEHEANGAQLAESFLAEYNYPTHRINQVVQCIMVTKMPQQPKNKLEEVMCDADLLHLGKEGFMDRSNLLRQELKLVCQKKITEKKWLKHSYKFVKDHQYFTDYARKTYKKGKKQNLELIAKALKKMKTEPETHTEDKGEKKEKDKKKDKSPDRGIETMFRLTSKNHLDLSAMADNKANILISINAIILSVVVSVLIRKLEEYPYLVIPTSILTLVCLVTIVIGILVTRPQISIGKFTKADIEKKKVNLLFFGNFHRMKLQEYDWAVKELMKDGEYLYSNLIQDIYFLGVVLGKKYRLLHLAYTFFMFGFVISVLSFLVAEVFFRSSYPY